MIRRLLPHPALSGLLVLVWLLLLNTFTVGGLLLGLAMGLAVPLFIAPYWREKTRIRLGWPLLQYLVVVLWDIVVANFRVAGLVLFRRNRDLRARWLVIPLEIRSPEAITTLAGTISLTPGTISADIAADGRALLVHALDSADPAADIVRIKSRYEARLLEIFR